MNLENVRMGRSAKGNDMLCIDGYLYYYDDRGIKSFRWSCNKRKDKRLPCKSRIITNLVDEDETKHKVVKAYESHSHDRCSEKEIERAMQRKRKADEEGKPCTLEAKYLKRRTITYEQDEIPAKKCKEETSTSAPTKTRVYMLKTTNGLGLVCIDGHLYRFKEIVKATPKNPSSYWWKCIKAKETGCAAQVQTVRTEQGSHELKCKQLAHSHAPFAAAKLEKLLNREKKPMQPSRERNTDPAKYEFEQIDLTNTPDTKQQPAKVAAPKRYLTRKLTPALNSADPSTLHQVQLRVAADDITMLKTEDPLQKADKQTLELDLSVFYKLTSSEGTEMLCVDNYLYNLEVQSAHKKRNQWTCIHSSDKLLKCKASITTLLDAHNKLKLVDCAGEHMHGRDETQIKQLLSNAAQQQNGFELKTEPQNQQLFSVDIGTDTDDTDDDDDHESETSLSSVEENYTTALPKLPVKMEKMKGDFKEKRIVIKPEAGDGSNVQCDMNLDNICTLRSAKGGELLCIDDFIYHVKSKSSKDTRTYWECIKSKNRLLNCKSRVTTVMTRQGYRITRVTNLHSHRSNNDDVNKRLINTLPKARMLNAYETPEQADDDFDISQFNNENKYSEMLLLKRNALKSKMNLARMKMRKNSAIMYERSVMKLYAVSDGPPSLAVRMTLKALKISYELVNINFNTGEHLTEEYAKLNPQKEIPVLDDDGFYLSESIAIMQYLCDKYAPHNQIYPKDSNKRAKVNQRLCFNMAFYYAAIGAHVMAPIFFDYQRSDMSLKKVQNALQVFETYLERAQTKYAAGEHLTIADLPLVTSTLCLEAIGFDISAWPLVSNWYETFKQENPELWLIAEDGMREIAEYEKNPPDLSKLNHPFHPVRKS